MKNYLVFLLVSLIMLSGCIKEKIDRITGTDVDLPECDGIKNQSDREKCYESIAHSFTSTEKKLSFYDQISDKIKLCDKIRGQDEKSLKEKDRCYINIAMGIRGVRDQDQALIEKICEKRSTQYRKDICYESCILLGHHSLCEKIQNQGLKDKCYSQATWYMEDPSICDKIPGDSKRFCYAFFAKIQGNLSFCDKIHGEGKSQCYDDAYIKIAATKQDPSLCEKIQVKYKKYGCYRVYVEIAATKQDPSLCEKIEARHERNTCYDAVAIAKRDPSLCDEIDLQDKRVVCHAVVKQDPSLCDNFFNNQYINEDWDRYFKKECYKKIERAKIDGNTELEPSPSTSISCSNFVKLQPLLSNISYTASTGDFTAGFMNTERNMKITNASVIDKLDDSIIWSVPTINGVNLTVKSQVLMSEETFRLNAVERDRVRDSGDEFDLEISITYDTVMGGSITSHSENGHIRGPVE